VRHLKKKPMFFFPKYLFNKRSNKEHRNSVRHSLHASRARRSVAQIAAVTLIALFCIALPTSIAAFVLIAEYEPVAAPFCPDTPLGTWAAIVAVFNVCALLCLLPWIIRPHRVKRYVAVGALWIFGATQIGLVIWGATIWISASPPAKCVAAYGGSSSGLGVMATILFAFTIAIWLTVCLGLIGNNINSKLMRAEIELGVTQPEQAVDGETAQQKWERERDERNAKRANRVPIAAVAAKAPKPAQEVAKKVDNAPVAAKMVDEKKTESTSEEEATTESSETTESSSSSSSEESDSKSEESESKSEESESKSESTSESTSTKSESTSDSESSTSSSSSA
jgi:hypothetical protein